MIKPSAPAAMAARAMGVTYSQWPVEWLGSRNTGKWVSDFRTGMELISVVLRVEVLKSANAALAQDNTLVAVRQDIFGRHQQLFNGG